MPDPTPSTTCPMCNGSLLYPNAECLNRANHRTSEQVEAHAEVATLAKVFKKITKIKQLNAAKKMVKEMLAEAKGKTGG